MKFGLAIFFSGFFAYLLGVFFPWWTITIAGFVSALIWSQKNFKGFLQAFIGVGILWLVMSFGQSYQNQHLLVEKIGALLGIKSNAVIILPLITALIGALIAGLGGLTGGLLLSVNGKKL
ncbi:MAG TPA: hypothetical protein PKX92_12510 [Edaphocola sp.]|nr:hypothetical protein [Edaphocola sp.]